MSSALPSLALCARARRTAPAALAATTLALVGALSALPAQAQDAPAVAIPGTHNAALGCPEAALDCGELTLDEASGRYSGSFRIEAGDYEFRTTVDGQAQGGPVSYSHAGGIARFVFDPATQATFVNHDILTVAGTWNTVQTSSWGWEEPVADDLTTLLTDADGDGTYSVTLEGIGSGLFDASLATNLGFGRLPEHTQQLTNAAGFPVSVSFTPATGQFTVTPEQPGVYDADDLRAFWVDGDTLAFPANVPVTVGGQPQSTETDTFDLYWSDTELEFVWYLPSHPWGVLGYPEQHGSMRLSVGAFSNQQLAQTPGLAQYIALDVPAGAPTPGELTGLNVGILRDTPSYDPDTNVTFHEWQALVGVYPAGQSPIAPEVPGEPEEPVAEGREVVLAGVGSIRLPIPEGADVLSGDWNGDGIDTIAWREGNRFTFTSANVHGGGELTGMWYGMATDEILVGDWDGDGKDAVGIRRGNQFHLSNSIETGRAHHIFWYGRSDDEAIVGDWSADGRDTVGVRRGNEFHLRNTLTTGNATHWFFYGRPAEPVLVGDWNGDGRSDVVIHRGNEFHANTTLRSGNANGWARAGEPGDLALLGNWSGQGRDVIGLLP